MGLPIVQASSDAWAEYGAQASRALNSGWVLDQRFDGIGGFITNASPTSSGLTFKSTGDATAFYLTGRGVQVVQAAGVALATVGLSSVAAGVTTIYLNAFSTAVGLSTALSTGAITSAAASPGLAGSTNANVFPFFVLSGSTGAAGSVVGLPGSLAIGATPATAGAIRIANAQTISSRNAANTGNAALIGLNATDQLVIGDGNAQIAYINNGAGSALVIGTNPAGAGIIRIPNAFFLTARNAANTANAAIVGLSTSDQVLIGDANAPVAWINGAGAALAIGTTPAAAGLIRIPNNQFLYGRNAANTLDVRIVGIDNGNQVFLGDSNATLAQVAGGSTGNTLTVSNVGSLFTGDWGQGSVVAANQTKGFLLLTASTGGAPSGVPVNGSVSRVPTYYDEANNRLYVYNVSLAAWKSVLFA